nr:hypothetical protein [Tanacetum cinerariifolium]
MGVFTEKWENLMAGNNLLFRIQEQVTREYVLEFLSSFTFREHIVELDNVDTMVFQLGGVRRIAGRHSGNEKVTLDDLFLLHSLDREGRVDVPWHVAKFFTDKAKGYKKKSPIVGAHLIRKIARSYGLMTQRSLRSFTLGLETSLLSVAKLVDLAIEEHGNVEGVRRHPNMIFTNRLRAMDERLGDIETNISTLSIETWNTDHLSHLLSFHHNNHTRYDGTPYSYVPNIPDLGVQQGLNFMSNTSVYSTAPSSSPNPFGLFDDANAGPFTFQNQGNDMDEE